VVGTFGYMAPEQFQGRALPQSDVYSLGATALALLTGRDPETLPHRGLAIDVPQVLGHDRPLSDVLSRMLDPDPDRRPQRVRPLLAGLPRDRTAAPDPRAQPPRTVTPQTAEHHGPRLPGGVILLIVLLGLAVARFSTAALFRVFLPVLLTLLSLFFGGGLRRTAKQMRDIGERGDEGLRKAREVVVGAGSRRERGHRRRQRVIDTEAESIEEEVRREVERELDREWDKERNRQRRRR
jgi:serine/threonine protein kinase